MLKINTKRTSIFLLTVIGILPIMLFAILWGFIYRINIEIVILLSFVSPVLYYLYWSIASIKLIGVKTWWLGLSLIWKVSIIAFVLITALQASMPTNIPDDGFYYLQTIKWANEEGIPLGVARFGFQYWQFSSWHVLQAVFNLSYFFGNQFNVLNGWIMIMFILSSTYNMNRAKINKQVYLVFGFFVVGMLQFFNTAPSPDLPVILLSLMVFKIFLFDERSNENFKLIVVLSLIAISIKISAFYLILFVIAFNYKLVLKDKRVIVIATIIGLLLISKSLITSGSLIFPFDLYTPKWANWTTDTKIIEASEVIKKSPFINDYSELINNLKITEKFSSWFNYKGYRGIVNKVWLSGIILLGLLALYSKSKKHLLLFLISLIHFVFLWVSAPYYRFAISIILINYFIIIDFLIGASLARYSKFLIPAGLLISGIWLTPVIHPIQKLSTNEIITISYPIKLEYLLTPTKPFISDTYEEKMFNGEAVFIPPGYHYAWDGPLPCVMRNHYERHTIKE